MASLDQFKSQIDLFSLDINNLDDNARAELLRHLVQKIGSLSQKKQTNDVRVKSEGNDEIESNTVNRKETKVIKKERVINNESVFDKVHEEHQKKDSREDKSKDASLAILYNGKLPTCKKCKESFRSLGALDDHVDTVHKEEEDSKVDNQIKNRLEQKKELGVFDCTKCDKVFENYKNLRRHAIIHTDRHKCKGCGKRCLQASDLMIHNRSPMSCKKYLDSIKRTEDESKTKSPKLNQEEQPRRLKSTRVEKKSANEEKKNSNEEPPRRRSVRVERKSDDVEKKVSKVEQPRLGESLKEGQPRTRRLLPKENVELKADSKQEVVKSISKIYPHLELTRAIKNSGDSSNTQKEEEQLNNKVKVDSKSKVASKERQFCHLCDVKVGGNSNNYRLHVGGAVHQELALQQELGLDPRQLRCRVCQNPSGTYKAFQTHLRMHPAPTEATKGSENSEMKETIDDENQETNSSEKKVMNEKKIDDDSQANQTIERQEDGEDSRDSFETNSDDEVCSEKSSESENLMEHEDDESRGNKISAESKGDGWGKDSNLIEDVTEFQREVVAEERIKVVEKEEVNSLMEANFTESDEEDIFEDIEEGGKEIHNEQATDTNDEEGSDESEIELDDAELLDDEEIEEFHNQDLPVVNNFDKDEEELGDFSDMDHTTSNDTDDEMDEDEDEEEMRQCGQCHKYFPDPMTLTDHMRSHIREAEQLPMTIVKEESNTYRSSLMIPDFILDTLR